MKKEKAVIKEIRQKESIVEAGDPRLAMGQESVFRRS
jgi:hypothetical protein